MSAAAAVRGASARLRALPGGDDPRHSVDALLPAALRKQVPDAGLEDEAERVEAARDDGRAPAVADVEAAAAPERPRDHRQVRGAVLFAKQATGVDVEQPRGSRLGGARRRRARRAPRYAMIGDQHEVDRVEAARSGGRARSGLTIVSVSSSEASRRDTASAPSSESERTSHWPGAPAAGGTRQPPADVSDTCGACS